MSMSPESSPLHRAARSLAEREAHLRGITRSLSHGHVAPAASPGRSPTPKDLYKVTSRPCEAVRSTAALSAGSMQLSPSPSSVNLDPPPRNGPAQDLQSAFPATARSAAPGTPKSASDDDAASPTSTLFVTVMLPPWFENTAPASDAEMMFESTVMPADAPSR